MDMLVDPEQIMNRSLQIFVRIPCSTVRSNFCVVNKQIAASPQRVREKRATTCKSNAEECVIVFSGIVIVILK